MRRRRSLETPASSSSIRPQAGRSRRTHSRRANQTGAFAEALLSPPKPNERLRAAARRYRALIGA
ncbi:MAG: DUF1778 domain-containing protein [Proteobacteria bacterium]|nr:DUF1778 domain-containing protein [Pseudomonadota bacterium]